MKIIERINGKIVYREMAEDEIAEYERFSTQTAEELIEQYKSELSSTDYKAIKHAEGWIDDEEYEPIKAHREKIRQKIRELERTKLTE